MKPLFKIRLDYLDYVCWALVILFFVASSLLFKGHVLQTILGGAGIVLLMFLISHNIEIILGVLRNHKRAGEFTGYITNGPEALCVIVGLLHSKLLFAVGVPLGSNFANPILLLVAAIISGTLARMLKTNLLNTILILIATMTLASMFYLLGSNLLLLGWVGLTLLSTTFLYRMKGSEIEEDAGEEEGDVLPPVYIFPAISALVGAGYFLDPVVSYSAEYSRVPEGAISFFVLSFITSWPEFRSVISLIRINRLRSAVINILVSNITNLWLASLGVLIYLLIQLGL